MGNYLVNVISVDHETRYCLLNFSLFPPFQEYAALSTQRFPNTAQVCSSSGWGLVTPFWGPSFDPIFQSNVSVSYTINISNCMGTAGHQRELRLFFTLMIHVSFLKDTHKNYNRETKIAFLSLWKYCEKKSIGQHLYCIVFNQKVKLVWRNNLPLFKWSLWYVKSFLIAREPVFHSFAERRNSFFFFL